uniref:Uncharacterized protein n=1 Tax=Picea sitchensis TaxID=3332 RepID=A0A6B9XXR2_PICSI|nr:hypothetical protein Q903MT_gene6887 [Picea sitchensis]
MLLSFLQRASARPGTTNDLSIDTHELSLDGDPMNSSIDRCSCFAKPN